ncbi:hypothetical protein [Neptuniibacter pectenicola]|uniref:hypothetical protein n=1 Tax=Neptuniibacter pectenicola TaxID=1806669 RepID=UPI0030EB13FD|tara:strand:- start:9 stop:197 length:189 start_codon:yes stop_codon:yes gene_type:complete
MKAKAKIISVDINEREALQIINILQAGVTPDFVSTPEEEGAKKLLELLRSNFKSQVQGVHIV